MGNFMSTWSKASRFSAWVLTLLCVIYLATGFAMTGTFGFHRIIGVARAGWIHSHPLMYWTMIVTLLIHGGYCGCLALKRRGLIK